MFDTTHIDGDNMNKHNNNDNFNNPTESLPNLQASFAPTSKCIVELYECLLVLDHIKDIFKSLLCSE